MNLTERSLKKPVALTVLVLAALALGIFSLNQLDVDYLPDITYPMVKIHIWWRGATPAEIEVNIAEPLERIMATVDNLDYLESSTLEGMYTLLVNFQYGVKVDHAFQDVVSAMERAERHLPPDIDTPLVIKADPSFLPVIQVVVSSDRRSLVWLREWADNWLTDRLVAVPGTGGVEIVGGLEREIQVHLDPERLSAFNLSPDHIVQTLSRENREVFAGRVTLENREIIARTMGEFESLGEIENIVVTLSSSGEKVYLKDIAAVADSHEEMRINTRFNGKTCVKLSILKQAEANTVEVSRAVMNRLAELQRDIPKDIEFDYVENQGDYITGAIKSVQGTAFLAAILVILVVFMFLGQVRFVAVMISALGVTLLANFFVMETAGFSINIFSLGGLVVALGVILDNSIVVLENIIRVHKSGTEKYALKGTSQVSSAIITATLTFLVIFLPFLFIPGLTSLLFRELVLVVAVVVVLSLIVAVTITPALTQWLLKARETKHDLGLGRFFYDALDRLIKGYVKVLRKSMRAKAMVVVLIVIVFAVSWLLISRIGSEFLPKMDDGRVMIKVMMPSGTAMKKVDQILAQLESQIQGLPEIESTFTLAGGRVWGLATFEVAQEGEIDIQLVPESKRKITTQGFINKITPLVRTVPVPGGKISVRQRRVEGIRKTGEQEVEIKIKGTEIVPIFGFAKDLARKLENTSGIRNVNVSMDMTKPEYRIHIDRARASAMGIPVGGIAETLRTLVHGTVATQYREGLEYYDIRVMVPERMIRNKSDLEDLIIDNNGRSAVYLGDVAEVRRSVGPVEIVRENQAKEVIVRMDPSGISVGEVVSRVQSVIEGSDIPAGVEWEMGGQAQLMQENRQTMGLIILFAALFAYIILAVQFESFSLPFLIMAVIPLALTGSFLSLYLTGTPIGVTVLVGLVIMMAGIISQGVVLLSLAEEYFHGGKNALDAILTAAPVRVRPVLMTQLTTVIGLIPLALNFGEGGDMLQPLAIAVIGGLLYSLVLTLFFLPATYVLIRRK
jgi:hydrophobic/amphiphilic exporter-1 (mainly G- bacteria), HAE1 family